jgi:nicotinamide riboside kinase
VGYGNKENEKVFKMIILICGPQRSGKSTLAKPLAELLKATYVTQHTYHEELKGYVDGLVAAGNIVVIDKPCKTAASVEYLEPDYVVWLDTIEEKTEKPKHVDYHVAAWFTDTHEVLKDVVTKWMERNT